MEGQHLKNNTISVSRQALILHSSTKGVKQVNNVDFPLDEDRATLESDLSADGGFVADRSVTVAYATGGTPIRISTPATKRESDKLALPLIARGADDCSAVEPSEEVGRISSDMAYKLPMEGQAEAHRDAIRKAEHRKASNMRVSEKMEAIDHKKAERMKDCCSVYVVREYPDKRLRHGTQTKYCSNRFCATCAHRRSMRLIGRYSPILRDFLKGRWMYHVVLTYKNDEKPIGRKKIAQNVRSFRRRDFWKEYGIAGGLYSVEATGNVKSNTIHTHIHMLLFTEKKPVPCIEYGKEENKGRFQLAISKEMGEEWLSITGNSDVVYGGKVKGGVYEVLKYITKFQPAEDGKGDGIEVMPDDMFKTLYGWTVGSRFISAFGGLYGKVSKKEEMEDEEGGTEPEFTVDYGNEPYVEYVYEFRDRLKRYVIVAERVYTPSVSRNSYTYVRRE